MGSRLVAIRGGLSRYAGINELRRDMVCPGDFMTPPPPDKHLNHPPLELDFGRSRDSAR